MVRETHSPNTEGPIPFKFQPKDSQPLQQLSPERVNSVHTSSTTVSTITKHSAKDHLSPTPSPQTSPTRRAKASLFADYEPNRGSPTKGSLVLGGGGVPLSPSLPEITALRSHGRNNSDVQGLVKRFEHLDVRDRDAESAERIRRREAELRRAVMAREEAESETKKFKAEMRRMERLVDEGAEREKIVGRRVEVLMDDLAAAKAEHASQRAVYEKELRKARKEAFKTSSAVVKLQEDLKATRKQLRCSEQDREMEKRLAQQKEQERFELEYQLVPLQVELDKLERHLRVAQEETMALKASLKEEEVARIAAEGRIPLPPSQDGMDEFAWPRKPQSPVKRAPSPLSDDKENLQRSPKKATAPDRKLVEDLEREKMRRLHAEELADFLQMECTFRCCGCKRASRLGHELSLSLDDALNEGMAKIREGMQAVLSPPASVNERHAMDIDTESAVTIKNDDAEQDHKPQMGTEESAHDSPQEAVAPEEEIGRSIAFAAEPPRPASPSSRLQEEAATSTRLEEAAVDSGPAETATSIALQPSTPLQHSSQRDTTPFRPHPSVRTVTTTTTIPMHFTPVSKPTLLPAHIDGSENVTSTPADPSAPTFDRAAALAAIEYRRGRAKSLANGTATPRKQMVEGVVGGRRDISAPALGQQKGGTTGGSGMKVNTTGSVGRALGRRMV